MATTKYVADSQNTLAQTVIGGINTSQVIEKVQTEKVTEILNAKLAQQTMPETATVEEKAVWALPVKTIQAAVAGEMKSSDFYIRLLRLLPTSID